MTRLRSFMAGRWGFVLCLAALALVGGSYYLRFQVLNKGLKVFDRKGDMVLVVSPEDHARVNTRMVEAAWRAARRHPDLNDIRFIIYVDKKTVLDQFGQPPQMDIYLGNIFLPPAQVEAIRRIPSLEEALARCPVMYLDWEWTYQRGLVHLAADAVSAPVIPKGRDWAVSLNWVLFNMLPDSGKGQRWTQDFKPGWTNDPNLISASPALAELEKGPVGVSPTNPKGELIYRFDLDNSWVFAHIRDIHTAWEPTESVSLEASTDGESWRPVYRDQGGNLRRLTAVRLTPESLGGRPEDRTIYLRYTMELLLPSARSGNDLRGANLSFLDVRVEYVE